MSDYKTSEAQLKATKKYLSKFADLKIRVTPEFREVVQEHAKAFDESTSAFIKRAIVETMDRDQSKSDKF